MELALIPIAALLLLLTGVGVPGHAIALESTAAAVLRHLFTATDETKPEPSCRKTGQRARRFSLGRRLLGRLRQTCFSPLERARTRDLRVSRFASAAVAYRTTAPPEAL